MAALHLAGAAVLAASIMKPRVGAWVAEVEIAADTAPAGAVELTPETGSPWRGTVISGGVHAGTWRGRVVGGAGGIRRLLPATSYRNASLQDILADVAREAGETLDAATDLHAWATALFVRMERAAGLTVADVASAAALPWRLTRTGALRIAAETWPETTLTDVTVTAELPHVRRYELAGSVLGIDPGMAVPLPLEAGATVVRVADVVHRIEGDEVTAVVWGFDG